MRVYTHFQKCRNLKMDTKYMYLLFFHLKGVDRINNWDKGCQCGIYLYLPDQWRQLFLCFPSFSSFKNVKYA